MDRACLWCFCDRHDAQTPRAAAVRLSVRAIFPSLCGQLLRSKPWRVLGPRHQGLPGQRPWAALASAASRRRSARAGGHGLRTSGVPGTHEVHRRGDASAASRRRKAHARVVASVRLSAQPPADWSVQRLMPRRRRTAPAGRWAARPLLPAPRRLGNAIAQPLRLVSPHRPPRGSPSKVLMFCSGSCWIPGFYARMGLWKAQPV